MFNKKLQKFSIRKLTVGAASVLIGISFISMNDNNTVYAADIPTQTNAQSSQDKLSVANDQLTNDQASLNSEKNKTAGLQQDVDAKQKEAAEASSKAQNAQEQTKQAKKALDEAQNVAKGKDQAEQNVANKKAEADNAKTALEQATKKDKQIKADEGKKKEEISNQNKEISKTKDGLKEAKNKQADAQNKLETAKNDVNEKSSALNDANNKTTAAQNNLTNSQNAADQAQADKQSADQKLANDQAALENAKTAVENKTTDVTNAENDLSSATTSKNQANEKVKTAKSDLDSANSALTAAKNAVKPYQDQLEALNNKLDYLKEMTKNTINLGNPRQYTEILLKYLNKDFSNEKHYTPEELDYLTSAERDFLDNGSKQNKYISSDVDKKIKIDDLNNLTDEQITELSLFAQDIINAARKQLNPDAKNDTVTKGSIEFAKQVAQRYIQDLKDGSWTPGWHDAQGINDVARANNMDYWAIKANKNQIYEDWSYGYPLESVKTMDDLKALLYDSLRSFLLPDRSDNMFIGRDMKVQQEMDHARGVLGVHSYKKNLEIRIKDLQKELNDDEKLAVKNPNITFSAWNIKKEEWDDSQNKEYIEFDELAKQLNEQIAIWNNKLKSLNQNQLTPDMLKESYISSIGTIGGGTGSSRYPSADIHTLNVEPGQLRENSKFDLTEIPSYQDQIKSVNDQIADVTSQAQPFLNALQSAQEAANNKQTALNNAKTKLQAATTTYNQAQQALQNAKDDLATAKNNVQSLQNSIANDETAVNSAQDKLTAALNDVDDKKQKLQAAKDQQNLALQNLDAANQKLDEARNKANDAASKVNDIKTALNNKNSKLAQLKNELTELVAQEALLPQAQQKATQSQQALKTAQQKLSQIQAVISDLPNKKAAYNGAKANSDKLNGLSESAQAALKQAQAALLSNQKNISDLNSKVTADLALIADLKRAALEEAENNGSSDAHFSKTETNHNGSSLAIKETNSRLKLRNGIIATSTSSVNSNTSNLYTNVRLPQTGTKENSMILVLFGTLVSMIGLAGTRKKKN